MIQFFVNKKEIVLPDDFAFTWIEENPEITSAGEFSLDMEFSLLEDPNAIAFKFINRKNVTDIDITADATMIDNGRVHLGQFIVSKNTDISVTGQFIAGNSEFRYLAKNEKKIWELKSINNKGWGSEPAINYTKALASIATPGYSDGEEKRYFVCAPIKIGTEMINTFTLQEGGWSHETLINGLSGKIIMQPYLLYYVNKLPELLGYTLKYNVLNDDSKAKAMYIVNAADSLNYADALPDMTVTEFIEAIENFFNVSFLIDSKDKSLSIHNFQTNLALKKTVKLQNALDTYDRNFDSSSKPVKFGFTKISYDLADDSYFKYQKLADSILSKCEIKEFATFNPLFNYLVDHYDQDKYIIYRDLDKGDDYINIAIVREPVINLFNQKMDDVKTMVLANRFRSYVVSDDAELVLKINPALIIDTTIPFILYDQDLDVIDHIPIQIPKSSNSYSILEDIGLKNSIETGTKDVARLSKIEVAFYMGKISIEIIETQPEIYYPFSTCDKYPVYGPLGHYNTPPYQNVWTPPVYNDFEWWRGAHFYPAAYLLTMALNGTYGIISTYHQQSIIDMSKPYTFTFPDGHDISANNIFEIDNLKYIPISLERQKSNKETTVLGKFYRMLTQ